MSVKTFVSINDKRWKKYRIDFAHIVNVALDFALQKDTAEKIIRKANEKFIWKRPLFGLVSSRPFDQINREVSIILTNDSEIRKLNKKYRKIDKPTNVLSFETGDAELLGDIYISFDAVLREAQNGCEMWNLKCGIKDNKISHFTLHTSHLIVHGVLHLLGYDHLKKSDAKKMESLEIKILAKLGIANPYEEIIANKLINRKRHGLSSPPVEGCPQGGVVYHPSRTWLNQPVASPASASLRRGKRHPSKGGELALWNNQFKSKFILIIFSVFFGAIASLGFAPFYFWWATIVGIAGMYYLIAKQNEQRANNNEQIANSKQQTKIKFRKKLAGNHGASFALCSLLIALCFGASYAVASFWWMTHSIYVVPELTAQFAVWTAPAIIGLGLAGALIFSIPFIVASRVTRHASRPVFFAGAWTVVLWLREWLLTGFPWNPIANIAMPWSALSNSMALWGALGLTFIIIGFIASLVELGIKDSESGIRKYSVFIIFIVLIVIGIGYGHYNIRRVASGEQSPLVIRIVQPAFSQEEKGTVNREQAIASAEENIRKLLNLAQSPTQESVRLVSSPTNSIPPRDPSTKIYDFRGARDRAGKPDIVVFPETAYPFVLVQGRDELSLARELGVPVIMGATTWRDGKFFNSMVLANADGAIEKIYSKSHLVPFGEYRPFGDLIPTPGQLTKGDGPVQLAISNEQSAINFVPAICYEIIFSDSLVPPPVRSVRLRFATPRQADSPPSGGGHATPRIDAIVNITNDTWFGKTPGTFQHLDMARRYAIESGLPIVRANYSGVSAFLAADGRIVSSLPVGVSGILDGKLGAAHITPYRRIGRDWMMAFILAFSLAAAIAIRRKNNK